MITSIGNSYDDVELVAAVGTVDALATHTGVPPDVVVLDLHLQDRPSGAAAVAAVRELGCPVLVLTAESDPGCVRAAMEAGAFGVLGKSGEVASLRAAIHAIASGESLITPEVASRIEANARAHARLTFTPALREVLQLLALGLDNQAIARRRHVSISTVKNQIREIRDIYANAGIEVGDRTDLQSVARRSAAGE